jgi:hypothetical protein
LLGITNAKFFIIIYFNALNIKHISKQTLSYFFRLNVSDKAEFLLMENNDLMQNLITKRWAILNRRKIKNKLIIQYIASLCGEEEERGREGERERGREGEWESGRVGERQRGREAERQRHREM